MKSTFLSELQRRNVLRAAAFYAAAGWVLVQVATQVFPFFDIPNSVVRIVVIAAVAGFPLALALSWFYEWTPQGLKRESQIDRSDPAIRAGTKRFDRWIIAALSLAVVLLLADRFLRPGSPGGDRSISEQSIAVLPFENLSADQGNAFFADGIQDEILTRLAKIGALRVISRTSTQQFASKPGNLPEIAHQLGVANILEGSVQRAGNAVRVTVQLIKAATDEHLWAETYDRKLDDIFAVESEVATSIAASLQVELTGVEKAELAARGTMSAAAHEAFLRADALDMHGPSAGFETLREAASLYTEATRLDPAYAYAWAKLAILRAFMYGNFIDRATITPDDVRQAAETALKLQPNLGEAYLALGYYHYRVQRDYDGGLQAFEQARQRLPNNADVLASIGYIERRQGKWQQSIERLEQSSRLDPKEIRVFVELATNYAALRDFSRARSTVDRALAQQPKSEFLIATKAEAFQAEGNLGEARALLDPLPIDIKEPQVLVAQVNQMLLERRFADASSALEAALVAAKDKDPMLGYCRTYLAWSYQWAHDDDAAHRHFAAALEQLQAMRKSDEDDRFLANIFAVVQSGLGNEAEALRWARRAVEANEGDALEKPRQEATLAAVLGWFGHVDEAIAMVPHLLEVPNGETRATLRLNPIWDSLRKDERFVRLTEDDESPSAAPAKTP